MSKERTNTKGKKAAFLKAYSECGSIFHACKAVKISRKSYYDWRASDKAFAEAADEAFTVNTERLEFTAYKRAVGTPAVYDDRGNIIRAERGGSDTLLIFLLKSRKPGTYAEHFKHEHSGEGATFANWLDYWKQRGAIKPGGVLGKDPLPTRKISNGKPRGKALG